MSVSSEISRIQLNRNTIRAKLVEMGMATNTANLDALARAIDELVDRGAVSVTVYEGDTYTIPAGYHNGSGTVSAVGGAGKYNLQSKNVTPTKKQQNVTPDSGYYGLSDVTVSPIPDAYQDVSTVNLREEDALVGKIFVTADGVVRTGTMVNNGAVSKTLDATSLTYNIPKGYHSGTGVVKIVLENKTVTPTKSQQEITATAGKTLGTVTVNPIPDTYQDVSGVTAVETVVLSPYKFVDSRGDLKTGSVPDNGAISGKIDGLTTTSYTVPAGYTRGGSVSLTNDIENALAAI